MDGEQGDYYQYLGLNQDSTASEIDAAFERKRMELEQSDSVSQESDLTFLLYVYEVLSNPDRREVYDSLVSDVKAPDLATAVQVSNSRLMLLDIPQIVYLLVEIKADADNKEKSLPLNLCLVVDCSTSMRGERLEQIKKGLYMLLDKLSEGDVLALVRFSDRAQVVLPARRLGDQKDTTSKIQALRASGGTEIYHGLSAGVGQIHQTTLTDFNNQLILITDGRTYGDEEKCLQLAASLADEGITLSAFGIGAEWDDQFLDALVGPSGGHSEHVNQPKDIVAALQKNVQGMGQVIANHAQLRAKWPRAVQLLNGFRLSPFPQPLSTDNGQILLGDIEGHTPLRFLLEFEVPPQTIPTRIRIPLRFEVEVTGQGKQKFDEKVSLFITRETTSSTPPPDIVRAVRLLTLHRLNEKVWNEVEAGQMERAAVRMSHLSTRFLEAGETILARQAGAEAERLSRLGLLSSEAHKNLKFGTRSLMGKTIQWDKDGSL